MFIYDQYDQQLVDERVAQFRDQTRRYLAGELSDDEFLALRLMNGLYIQRHAPMLRIAVPYGLLSSDQVRMLGHIARTYDKDYGHFTTRQNIQFNWIPLEQIPDVLADLASVQMHAIQTSGNCIRNTTTDPLAGVSADELEDPRPYCEIIRQWSTLHPEFAYLPRKFKIAVSGASKDRAVTLVHDIGLRLVKNEAGEIGFKVSVGGGLGRTPMVAQTIRPFLEKRHLLSYLEAILRVYNLRGRRDNKYKARIKILVSSMGADNFAALVEQEWAKIRDKLVLEQAEIDRIKAFFAAPQYDPDAAQDAAYQQRQSDTPAFARWLEHNTTAHKVDGYRVVHVSLKSPKIAPGDITAEQMDTLAELADQYSFGLLRSTYDQNLVLADVKQGDLFALWQALDQADLATPSIGTINDMICCPGLDFCSLANASSIDIAGEIQQRFEQLDYLYDLGEIDLKMSGCMNGCGHHSIGHIGILGVDKKGEEWYQFTLGGFSEDEAQLGQRLGKAIAKDKVADTVEQIARVYLDNRIEGERFVDTFYRIGMEPFKGRVYEANN
ncbi:sulfite reductase [Candidatus Tenderia electrophaga]|jgi:sulfite reductase (NADPH) hemoprotein beta-component|uniref:Sulfite reductase n=1 Tax=Candidatus Tenderia electrophaga TaxID=1748243 RepID=A0A0S2TBU7_9GAMM|nr:sulfite reductase [Candidatus Tenderia electrophaga]